MTPDKLLTGTGSSWDWSNWTPTLTGFSGTPSVLARYKQIGKTVHVQVTVTGTSNANSKLMSLPVAAKTTIDPQAVAVALTSSTANGDNFGQVYVRAADGNFQIFGGGVSPFTAWPTSGTATYRFAATYEAA